MSKPFDDTPAKESTGSETCEIRTEHEAGQGCVEILDCDTQREEGSEKSIGKLNNACREDERSNLRAYRTVRPHLLSPLRAVHEAERTIGTRHPLGSDARARRAPGHLR